MENHQEVIAERLSKAEKLIESLLNLVNEKNTNSESQELILQPDEKDDIELLDNQEILLNESHQNEYEDKALHLDDEEDQEEKSPEEKKRLVLKKRRTTPNIGYKRK